MIQYLEGDVFLNDRVLDTKIGKFEEMKDGAILRTAEGRAEVLLTPGSFLRIAESSSIKMFDARLASTRMEVLSGSVIVQVSEIEKEKDHNLTFISKTAVIELRKGGIYRIDASQNSLKVYKGEAQVEMAGTAKIVGTSKAATLAGEIEIAKFDNTTGDELYRWAKTRSGYLAVANVGAANTLLGSVYGGYNSASAGGANCFGGTGGYSGFNGRWSFNPNFGMFTYVPCNGMYRDPYGYSYYSPYTVQRVYTSYNPPASVGGASSINNPRQAPAGWSGPSYNSNLGYNTFSSRGDMNSYSTSMSGSNSSVSSSSATSVGSMGSSSSGHSGGGSSSGGGGGHSGGGHGGR